MQKFIKVLPLYFKTKNFASFVRQLNMYGFHKVKNDRGVHEFKHPQFKKDCYEELAHIKRKNILIGKDSEQQEKELDAEEFGKLKEKLETTKVSLETVTQQNINLISANKEVAGQLYNFKQDYENRLSKFFFMFYFIINSKNEGLLSLLKKTLLDLGVAFEDDVSKPIEQRTIDAAEYINNQVLLNSNCDHTIMNKLLNGFTFYVNVGDHSIEDLYYPDETGPRFGEPSHANQGEYEFQQGQGRAGDVRESSSQFNNRNGQSEMNYIAEEIKMEDDGSSNNEYDLDQIYDESVDQKIYEYRMKAAERS